MPPPRFFLRILEGLERRGGRQEKKKLNPDYSFFFSLSIKNKKNRLRTSARATLASQS